LPQPLPDEKRAELLRKAQAAGIPKEQAFKDLAALEGYGSVAPATAGAAPDNYSQGQDPFRSVPRGTPMMTSPPIYIPSEGPVSPEMARGLLVGGAALATAPFTAPMSLLPAAALEGAVAGGADLGFQSLRHLNQPEYEVKPKESLKVGLTQAVGTGAVRTAFDVLSRFAGVAPQFSRYFRDPRRVARFNRTMMEPKVGAEFELGEKVKEAVDDYSSRAIPERAEKVALMKQAEKQGVKISGQTVIDAIEAAKLQTPKTEVGKSLNNALTKLQDSFKSQTKIAANPYAGQKPGMPTAGTPAKVIRQVRPDLTPSEVDEFLTKELDNRIYKASGEPKDAALAEALANVRPQIKEALLSKLPAEARELTDKIFAELSKREVAEKAIKPELDSLETSIRNLFKPGNEGERRAIKYVGEKMGVDLEGEAFKLAQQRAFSPDQRMAAKGLDAILELIRGAVARPAAKLTAPLQSLIAPGVSGTVAARKEKRRIRKLEGRIGPSQATP